MSRFRDELRVIPGTAKAIAWVAALGVLLVVVCLALTKHPSDGRPLPLVAKILMAVVSFAFPFIYFHLIGYVYGDAKRRGMHYVMWTLLAIFIPNAIGVILYFILRDPLSMKCSSCSASVQSRYSFCPSCGTSVKPACPNCGKSVEAGWTHCAYCGTALAAGLQKTA